MAHKIPDFSGNEKYSGIVQNIIGTLDKIDINQPEQNILTKETSVMQLLKIQSEIQSQTIGQTLEYLKHFTTHADKNDDIQLIAENAGDKVTVNAQKDFLDQLAQKNYLVTRMLQKIENDKDEKAHGSYFDPTRETIIHIPETIANGQTDTISDSALKLINTFQGDSNSEAEKLKLFLRSVFDVAQTNDLNEKAVTKVLKRKLENTARKLIDSYDEEFFDKPNPPTLRQIVLKLEDRFCSEYQPQVASARLSMYTKAQNQTYQALEADISELTTLAARGEDIANRPQWIKQKKVAVFKQAISEEDRKIVYRENQTRTLSGLPEMTMSQMVDLLIKTYSEQNAFATASNLKNHPKLGDSESIQMITERKTKKQKRQEQNQVKKAAEENKIKDDLFAMYDKNRQSFSSNFKGKGQRPQNGGRNGYQNNAPPGNNGNQFTKGNGYSNNNGFNNGFKNGFNNGNQRGGGSNGNNRNVTKPRVFVTQEMVNTNPNCCLKCNSPTHRFSETDKCVYGKSNLMTKPCFSCGQGGHHFNICIKNQKPTVGAQDPRGPQEPLDSRFSKYPSDMTKNIPERPEWSAPFPKEKNEGMPSLFPW